MKCKKTVGRLTAALGLVVLFSVEAAAQVPPLSAVAVGNVVTIDIGEIPGVPPGLVQGHTLVVGSSPGGSEILTINLPANLTHLVVTAPDATYYLRVQAFAGAVRSLFSQEVSVTTGLPACTTAPTAPLVTPTVTGGTIKLDWTAVPGASHYNVHWAQFSGTTFFTDTIATNTHSRYAGILGTFFARVQVTTPCGTAVSEEVPFTIENLALGSGPRTPDPPPGQLLPMPGYAAGVVDEIARTYSNDLRVACHGNTTWLFKLVRELRRRDSRWGLNWKRGYRNSTMSADVVTYNPTDGPDVGAQHIYLVDVISGVCESNIASFQYTGITNETWEAGRQGLCANRWCAEWTIAPYLAAGYPPDEKQR
jgi:hypothetical protein